MVHFDGFVHVKSGKTSSGLDLTENTQKNRTVVSRKKETLGEVSENFVGGEGRKYILDE